MDVVRHQAPGMHNAAVTLRGDFQAIAVVDIIVFLKEYRRAAVTALDDMMRLVLDNEAQAAGHGTTFSVGEMRLSDYFNHAPQEKSISSYSDPFDW